MRISLVLALGCWALAAAGAAETAEQRGKRVVQEALQALGGDAFLNMRERVESGRAFSFYRSELAGLSVAKIYTRYLKPQSVPAGKIALRERQAFGKDEYASVLFTEDGAWEINFRGARPLADQRYENFLDNTRRNIFYILRQRLNEPGMLFSWRSSEVFENRPVDVVDITDADNRTTTVYFNRETKLPMRQTYRRRNPEFKDFDTELTIFAKYQDSGGVKWPLNIRRERNGEKIYEMFSDAVEINGTLTDDVFTLPAGVTVLPKQK